jgi:radical SAM protein with 4Fe4S-binding SPASM domain
MSDRYAPEARKIIGISGGSGAGNSNLARAIAQHLDGQALHLNYDEPSTGEHCKRCTYQKHCGAACDQPEPLPEGERKLKLVQLALAV